jgi:hypothetical protein
MEEIYFFCFSPNIMSVIKSSIVRPTTRIEDEKLLLWDFRAMCLSCVILKRRHRFGKWMFIFSCEKFSKRPVLFKMPGGRQNPVIQ